MQVIERCALSLLDHREGGQVCRVIGHGWRPRAPQRRGEHQGGGDQGETGPVPWRPIPFLGHPALCPVFSPLRYYGKCFALVTVLSCGPFYWACAWRWLGACWPPEISPARQADVLVPHDGLRITVAGEGELSGGFVVNSDGNVRLELLGAVLAAGLSPAALQEKLRKFLAAGHLKNPQVLVERVAPQLVLRPSQPVQ